MEVKPMTNLENGVYDVDIVNHTFIHRRSLKDYGPCVKDWSILEMLGVDDIFTSICISIFIVVLIDTSDDALIIRYPCISYTDVVKITISDVFDLTNLSPKSVLMEV